MFPFYVFTGEIRECLKEVNKKFVIMEVRLRLNQPLGIRKEDGYSYISRRGGLCSSYEDAYIISQKDLAIVLQKLTQFSMYAFKDEIGEGFVTLPGGHRAGICGKVIYQEDGKRVIRDITSLNIRIAHQIIGCADNFYPCLEENGHFLSTLIISPPGCGKTTLLRELIRVISSGFMVENGQNVGVVDERSEIGNYTKDHSGFDLGPKTDLLDHCKKSDGMLFLLRTMSPEVIAADEIGDQKDIEAIKFIRFCGCSLLLTIHGNNLKDLLYRPYIGEYLKEHPFQRYIEIENNTGSHRQVRIYNEKQVELWSGSMKGHQYDH